MSLASLKSLAFSKAKAKLGSGLGELLSFERSLESRPNYFENKKGFVSWLTDSQNGLSFLLRGSNKGVGVSILIIGA